jgi:hypothetical protein
MQKNLLLLALAGAALSGCCAISCNSSLPNSFVKVMTPTPADCAYEDKAGVRKFKAPGDVLGMPKNAPGTLTCTARGYKPFVRTVTAEGWSPLTPLSGDPDALRYFIEIEMSMEPDK